MVIVAQQQQASSGLDAGLKMAVTEEPVDDAPAQTVAQAVAQAVAQPAGQYTQYSVSALMPTQSGCRSLCVTRSPCPEPQRNLKEKKCSCSLFCVFLIMKH